jgi:hypothetical protein
MIVINVDMIVTHLIQLYNGFIITNVIIKRKNDCKLFSMTILFAYVSEVQ